MNTAPQKISRSGVIKRTRRLLSSGVRPAFGVERTLAFNSTGSDITWTCDWAGWPAQGDATLGSRGVCAQSESRPIFLRLYLSPGTFRKFGQFPMHLRCRVRSHMSALLSGAERVGEAHHHPAYRPG